MLMLMMMTMSIKMSINKGKNVKKDTLNVQKSIIKFLTNERTVLFFLLKNNKNYFLSFFILFFILFF